MLCILCIEEVLGTLNQKLCCTVHTQGKQNKVLQSILIIVLSSSGVPEILYSLSHRLAYAVVQK